MSDIDCLLDGKYEIIREIGRGGMSVVYLARDVRLGKLWAVKEIKNEDGDGRELYISILKKEAQVIKNFDHPLLPRIVDIICTERSAYIVMDYIEGRSLQELLEAFGAQKQEDVVRWTMSLCEVLIYLHGMNPPVIYRDMKPSNIMLKPDGNIKLIDFGISKESKEDTLNVGTLGFAAPEQFGSEDGIIYTDERTDIYSLGATMYALLTGERPGYEIRPVREIDTSISEGLERIILKCTKINPEERYRSSEELLAHLRNYKKLEDEFRRTCIKNVLCFALVSFFSICFVFLSLIGYTGIVSDKNKAYEKLMMQGYSSMINEMPQKAEQYYNEAIEAVNGGRVEAYIELIRLYRDYYDDLEQGLHIVAQYIEQKYENINENSELLFEMGINYFEYLNDYSKSIYYFEMVDMEKYPEAIDYIEAAKALSELNVDYKGLSNTLRNFEDDTEKIREPFRRLQNYRAICDVYCRYIKENGFGAKELAIAADKGLKALEQCDDERIKAEYYITFDQYLIRSFEELEQYNKALQCTDRILEMVSDEDVVIMGSFKRGELRKNNLLKKAAFLVKMSEFQQACALYEECEKEYGDGAIDFYVAHLSLLCDIEDQKTSDVEKWNSKLIKDIYEKGNKISGIEDDHRWKRLKIRLVSLLDEGG